MTRKINLSELARQSGISRDTIRNRLRRGLSISQACKPGSYCVKNLYQFKGEMLSATEIARRVNLPPSVLHDRLRKGMPLDLATVLTAQLSKRGKLHTHDGLSLTLTEWSLRTGICAKKLRHRVYVMGMSISDAIRTGNNKARSRRRKPRKDAIIYKGQKISISELARRTGIPLVTLRYRIKVKGLSADEAIARPLKPVYRERLKRGTTFSHDGLNLTLAQWAKRIGVPYTTLHYHVMTKRLTIGEAIACCTPGVQENFPNSVGTGGGSVVADLLPSDLVKA